MSTKASIRLAALARAARIVKARDAGETWAVIAAREGRTRQRCAQVAAWVVKQAEAATVASAAVDGPTVQEVLSAWAFYLAPSPKPED